MDLESIQIDNKTILHDFITQLQFGPRVPGTVAHAECSAFLCASLESLCDERETQYFERFINGRRAQCFNHVGKVKPDLKQRILLAAHWDSRELCDGDDLFVRRAHSCLGANDSASGVAGILAVLRLLADADLPIGVDAVFFDAEDQGQYGSPTSFALGSHHFCQTSPLDCYAKGAIVLDLIGDLEARFPLEPNSFASNPKLCSSLWEVGERFAPGRFQPSIGPAVYDDHSVLIAHGVESVLVCDSSLIARSSPSIRRGYWHTERDTMDNISADVVSGVAKTLFATLLLLSEE